MSSPKIMTNCVVLKGDQILLGYKKRGFGMGRWNSIGGKVQEGETVEAAAIRELEEETGIRALKLEKVGMLNSDVSGDPYPIEFHIFKVTDHAGEPAESDEMRPRWFLPEEVPYAEMWPDDEYWMPLLSRERNLPADSFSPNRKARRSSNTNLRKYEYRRDIRPRNGHVPRTQ